MNIGKNWPIIAYFKSKRPCYTLKRANKSRHPVYTYSMYTRRVLDSCFRIRERGEKEQTRGSPVPRGLGVLSYLGRAAWWEEGGKDAGPYLRDPLLGPLSLSWPVLSNPSACLFASSPSFSTGRQRRPRSFSFSPSISLFPYCHFLHLIPPCLVVISTSSSRPRELTSGLS